MIKRMFLFYFQRLFTSWQFYLSISIIIGSWFITIKRNEILFNLNNMTSVGALNLFVLGNIIENPVMMILAPLVPVLTFSSEIYNDIKSGFSNNIFQRISPQKYIMSNALFTSLIGGLVFIISYLFLFLLVLIFDPTPSPLISFIIGPFSNIYNQSLLLFCIIFILHSFIFGVVYSLFGFGIAMNCKNKIFIYILPLAIYLLPSYLLYLLPNEVVSMLNWIIPFRTFEIAANNIPLRMNMTQLVIIGLISVFSILIGYKQLRQNSS